MKKTYIAPATENVALMIEDAILSISGNEEAINIKEGSVGAGSSLSGQKVWGNSSIWDNE